VYRMVHPVVPGGTSLALDTLAHPDLLPAKSGTMTGSSTPQITDCTGRSIWNGLDKALYRADGSSRPVAIIVPGVIARMHNTSQKITSSMFSAEHNRRVLSRQKQAHSSLRYSGKKGLVARRGVHDGRRPGFLGVAVVCPFVSAPGQMRCAGRRVL
jgi:hypothetical protein